MGIFLFVCFVFIFCIVFVCSTIKGKFVGKDIYIFASVSIFGINESLVML